MSGCRTAIGVGCWLVLGVGFGCGGAVEQHSDDAPPGAGASSQPPVPGGSSAGGSSSVAGKPPVVGGSSSAGNAGMPSGGSSDPPPVSAGCEPQQLPPPVVECDPFGPSTCGAGAGCYPFVDHPEGSGCDAQSFGTACRPAGVGRQGARCGDETNDWCAPGFVCVVGQRAGKRCAALCEVGAKSQCSGGLLCGDLDVSGYGACG